ncbi:uncharacterized protein L201_003954 [Kwoniella dendrophila CBS 6074]|uniref:F-box only protein 9 n=1 Tax=Kwoniella dendrophila CBS 6074 TaxID=1295534 RepID=A0AAX4JUC8_9TREE
MDTPATPLTPSTPASPDLIAEIDRLSINPAPRKLSEQAKDVDDEDELEKFRKQWREEVKAKKHDKSSEPSSLSLTKKGKEKEVEVGPVRWKSKEKDDGDDDDDDQKQIKESPKKDVIPLKENEEKVLLSSLSNAASSSPEKMKSKLPTTLSTTSPKATISSRKQGLNFVPGEKVDLDKLDSYLTSTTFTSFNKPSSTSNNSSKVTRFTGTIAPDGHTGNEKERAIQIYSKAVESEQQGKLNEALMLYRKAFKLDDDVDRSYAKSMRNKVTINANGQTSTTEEDLSGTPSSTDIISPTPPTLEPYSFARTIQTTPDYEKTHHHHHHQNIKTSEKVSIQNQNTHPISPLTKLFNSLSIQPNDLIFLPQEEELPCPISNLPNELFENIFQHLDVTSLERFGSTCWKSRWLTHISSTWRNIAERIYKPPAMLPSYQDMLQQQQHEEQAQNGGLSLIEQKKKDIEIIGVRDLVKRHRDEWRTTVVEEERIRMDGCYIAVCHYIRPGAGEEWVTITHMITYHRFLRFYPDGNVISFLTTDHPSDIVPSLRPSIRGKGLHFGRWKLLRSDSPYNSNIPLPPNSNIKEGKKFARILVTDLLEPGNETPKYEFEMELILKSTGRGRWNKLEILEYRSINLLTGEVLALALKHQKPFYFSKVRSYNPPF